MSLEAEKELLTSEAIASVKVVLGRVASLLPSVEPLGSFNPASLERNSLFLPPRTSLTSDGGAPFKFWMRCQMKFDS